MSDTDKRKLLAKLLASKKTNAADDTDVRIKSMVQSVSVKEGIKEIKSSLGLLKLMRQKNPLFRMFSGMMKPVLKHKDTDVINFAGYDYLGFASDERVQDAAIKAIREYGTSVSASRVASGERDLHVEFEREYADFIGTEDALLMVGGFAANASVIGHIMGPKDLILHDSLMHRSAIEGAVLSGAVRKPFPHNDLDALEAELSASRNEYRQCLILVEGLYSMDGDLPDLARLVKLKKKYKAMLLVDEAHSIGVLGETGRGIAEFTGISPDEVDIWMSTLSKSFASCGGVLAGRKDLIEYLRYTTPGFVFSVGATPANTAAALSALRLLKEEKWRATQARENGHYLYDLFKKAGLNVGLSAGYHVLPLIVGDRRKTIELSNALLAEGVNAQAIFHPVVAEDESRLRFFINAQHERELLDKAAEIVIRLYKDICC